jgi:[acyl-carrier-protein] S-malonyltransferase
MKPAEEKMALFFLNTKFNDSAVSIIQNVHAQSETSGEIIKKNIVTQVSAPVKWTQSMLHLKTFEQPHTIECGNGSVLKGLLKKIDSEFFKVYSTNTLDDLKLIETAQKN